MEIIRDEVITCLPFSPEAIVNWTPTGDLQNFLYAINDLPGVVLEANGDRRVTNYRHCGESSYHQGKKEFRDWAYRFGKLARDIGGDADLPDFYEDLNFGLAAKYIIAWNEGVMSALSSGTFFSIAHILESVDDLRCSLGLASQLYYKQAQQTLRSVLEDVLLPIYFVQRRSEYLNWKANNYRTPQIRGRNGIVRSLVDDQIIPEDLAEKVSSFYGELNGFVHGSERRLINSGHYSRTWVGHAFNQEDYSGWCRSIETSVILGMKLLRINLGQWEKFRSQRLVVCPICHNDNHFDTEEFSFGSEHFTKYHCKSCGDEVTHNSEGRETYRQSYDGEVISYQYLTG
jgi:hypothetical protein